MSAVPKVAETEGETIIVRPLKEREGRCFYFALLSLLEMRDAGFNDAVLVHGVITGYHRDRMELGHEMRLAHGWLERGDMAYEATADVVFHLADYYEIAGAVAERRYSAEQAIANCQKFSTFGPWHETEGAFT